MRLNGFFQAKLNGRKPSEKYRNLIPSYNIKGCFCYVLQGFLPIWICIYAFMRLLIYWIARLADLKVIDAKYK